MTKPVQVDSSGNIKIKTKTPENPLVTKMKEGTLTYGDIKPRGTVASLKKMWSRFGSVRKNIFKMSKKIGGMVERAKQTGRNKLREYEKQFANLELTKSLNKYRENDQVMSDLGNVKNGNLDPSVLPNDLREAWLKSQDIFNDMVSFEKSVGYQIGKTKSGLYFPFEVNFKHLEELRQLNPEVDAVYNSYLKELGDIPVEKLSPEQRDNLIQRLEEQTKVQVYTPEMMKYYKSMPDALSNRLNRHSEIVTDATLFGDSIKGKGKMTDMNFETLVSNLMASADDFQVKDIPALYENIISLYRERGFMPSDVFGFKPLPFFSALSANILVAGPGTVLKQLTSLLNNTRISGMGSTFHGLMGVAARMIPGFKSEAYIRKFIPMGGMQDVQDVTVSSMDAIMKMFKDSRKSGMDKAGKVVQKTSLGPLQFVDEWLEKELTYRANKHWLENNHSGRRWRVFKDRYKSLLTDAEWTQAVADLKGKKVTDLTDSLIRVRAGETLVTEDWDRSLLALGNEPGKWMTKLMSYAVKVGNEIEMNSTQLVKEGIKENNHDKILTGIGGMAGFLAIVPSYMVYQSYVDSGNLGASISKLKSARDYVDTGLQMTAPFLYRGLDFLTRSQEGSGMKSVANLVSPGLGTTAEVMGDAVGATMKAGPLGAFSPEENSSSRYMPPRILNQMIYNSSDAKKEADANRENRDSNVAKWDKRMADLKFLEKHPEFARTIDTNDLASDKTQKRIKDYKDKYNRLKEYGTTDVTDAQTLKIYEKARPYYKQLVKKAAKEQFEAGRISRELYNEVQNNPEPYILKNIKRAREAGQL